MNTPLTRRRFAQLSGLAAGGLLTMGCSTMKTNTKQLPIGLQLYSVRQQCEKDFAATIAKVAKLGYKGVEFAGYYGNDAATVRKMLADNGLQSCGAHTGIDQFQDDVIESTIAYNAEVGNKNLIIPWLSPQQYATKDSWLEMADFLNKIALKLEPHGMQVGYHNHTFEFEPIDGELPWDIVMQNTTANVIGQLDVGHCFHAGVNPAEMLNKYPGRAKTVHMKAWLDENPQALIGEDGVPWKDVFAACETTAGTEWLIVEEEHNPEPPFEAVQKCLENLTAIQAA